MRKKVLASINGEKSLEEGSTFNGLVNTINQHADARFIDSDGRNYNFGENRVRTMRFSDGRFHDSRLEKPEADLWIFYSDGYQTDTKALGYPTSMDYYRKLMNFLDDQIIEGNVREIISSPEVERATLKDYFTRLDPEEFNIIPTYTFKEFKELKEKFLEKGKLVVKPNWGGAMTGVKLIKTGEDLLKYEDLNISDLVFQDYSPGVEKRMWITNGNFVEGRSIEGRETPWDPIRRKNRIVTRYNRNEVSKLGDEDKMREFEETLKSTQKMVEKTGLVVGAIDFLGNKINEVNGAGTSFITGDIERKVCMDDRHYLNDYIRSLLTS